MAKERIYYELDRPEMLAFMPSELNKSIEFGCSAGRFSAMVKQQYQNEAWGVDLDREAVAKAQQVLDKVLLADAYAVIEQLPQNYFDCVICNDFLEHLVDPDRFLTLLRPVLTDSAYLVCSLPNVRFWKNIRELLFAKDWRYRDAGILDNTHLRFFTKKSMVRMMEEHGFAVELIKGINPSKSLKFYIPNFLTFGVHKDMQFIQFGIRAKLQK